MFFRYNGRKGPTNAIFVFFASFFRLAICNTVHICFKIVIKRYYLDDKRVFFKYTALCFMFSAVLTVILTYFCQENNFLLQFPSQGCWIHPGLFKRLERFFLFCTRMCVIICKDEKWKKIGG